MSGEKKINKINILLVFLIVMFILVTVCYVIVNSKSDNIIEDSNNITNSGVIKNDIENIIMDNIINNSPINIDSIGNTETDQEVAQDFYSEEIQNIFPITGAFPTANLAYISKLRNIERESINNDAILKLAFSKVSKEDWADSYISETEKLSIDASVLDRYVKQIFGEIEYKNDSFSNEDIKYDNNVSGIYNISFNEEENKYYIDINTGDVDQSIIEYLYPKAIKTSNKIEIIVHPIYIRNCGEVQDEEGNYTFSYIAYKHYNFETNSFVSRITDTMNEIWHYNEETGENEYNKLIQGIQEKDLETYVLTYNYNEKTDKYEFSSLISK